MPNQFKGQVLDTPAGNKLEGVKVTITGTGVEKNTSTVTDVNGNWLITLKSDVDPKNITVTFSKPGLETTSVKNPQKTAELPGYIDPIKGGILDLAGDYPSGKYKVTSLSKESQDVINKEIEDAYNFAKNNPGNFTLKIESSESQVPNADNEGTNKNFDKPGSLAESRALELETYINDKINTLYAGETNPSFQKPTVILDNINRVGDAIWDGINAQANKYTKDQYTRIKAELKKPRCEYIVETSPNIKGYKIYTKPPGTTKITLDAADAPDRFGIEFGTQGKLNNYYSQTLNPEGSLITWQYMMYIGNEYGKAKGMTPFLLDKNLLKTSLLADFSITVIGDNIKKYAGEKIYKGPVPTDINKLINDIISYTDAYGYEVRREETVFSLTDIQDNSQFTIIATNGCYTGGSAWQYKLCD
jgi:hypothetical protein